MAKQTILSTDSLPIGRGKINDNFTELYNGEIPDITADTVVTRLLRITNDIGTLYHDFATDGNLLTDVEIVVPSENGTIALQERSGWGYYVDSLATPSITITTSYTQITIDALGANILTYLPKNNGTTAQLWSANKITPIAVGGDYDGRFDITVISKTGAPSSIELIVDISGGVAGTNKVFTGYIQNLSSYPYDQSIILDFFSLSTFLANGGKLFARTDAGSLTISRRNIKLSKKY